MKNKKPLVYAISGKARHGKDTIALEIKKYYEENNIKVCIIPFAKYIKGFAKDYFSWSGDELTKPRKLLQELGTDVIRMELNDPLFHTRRVCEDINILKKYFEVFIIPDARFPNEIYNTKAQEFDVISIHVKRLNYKSELSSKEQAHPSETSLDNFNDYDIKIEAEDIEELKRKVREEI